jgi:hypothetical protein
MEAAGFSERLLDLNQHRGLTETYMVPVWESQNSQGMYKLLLWVSEGFAELRTILKLRGSWLGVSAVFYLGIALL